MECHRGRQDRERTVVRAPYLIGRREMMTINISLGRLLMKSRPAGIACGSFSARLHLLAASLSTSSAVMKTYVSVFTPCSGASAAPASPLPDGALRRHPRTLTALRTQSGVKDASGERRIVYVARMGGCGCSAPPLI